MRTVLFGVVAALLSACGGDADLATDSSVAAAPPVLGPDGKPAPTTSPEVSGPAPLCLAASEVSAAAGIPVSDFPQGSRSYGTTAVCAYQGTGASEGVFVTTQIAPAERADELFAKLAGSASLALGEGGAPDTVALGDRGLAFGAPSKSEAIAVAGDRVIHAEVTTASTSLGDRKSGMIALVRKLVGR